MSRVSPSISSVRNPAFRLRSKRAHTERTDAINGRKTKMDTEHGKVSDTVTGPVRAGASRLR